MGRRRRTWRSGVALVGVSLSWACADPAVPDPAGAVLDGAQRALGVPRDGRPFQVSADAVVEGPGGRFRTSIRSASDGRVRMEQSPSGFLAGVGQDGGWRRTEAGVEALGEGLAFVRGHELHMLALAPRTRLERPRNVIRAATGDRSVIGVTLSLPSGDSLVAWFDAVDTLPVGARVLWTDPPVEVEWSDWSSRGAFRVFERATFRQGTEAFHYAFDSIRVGEIEDAVFEPPASAPGPDAGG
ncbi:MAG TPA: hypothetical protein VK858_03965 [Longimicrobiales bacterium]|nr:hypothetical protein [Longimicrobiales bacterium]